MSADQGHYWVIYRKSDNAIMPICCRSGRMTLYSHTEFEDEGPPRLFENEISALRALTAWCMGKWVTDGDGGAPYCPNGTTKRNREDYGVGLVKISLI
jgi:hypothetical protein